jgi:hypothetical protein
MTKARWFFWIMCVNVVNFFIEAVSGFVVWFILPYSPRPIVPAPLFLFDRRTWIIMHQWGAIAITAMVVLHVVLHWNWIVKMAKSLVKAAKDNRAPAPAPAPGFVPVPARVEMPAHQMLAIKVAEGLGYLNSRQHGYVRLENAGSLSAGKGQSQIAGVAEKPLEACARADTGGPVKVVICHKCCGQIGWRLDLGSKGNCPHCGTLIHL